MSWGTQRDRDALDAWITREPFDDGTEDDDPFTIVVDGLSKAMIAELIHDINTAALARVALYPRGATPSPELRAADQKISAMTNVLLYAIGQGLWSSEDNARFGTVLDPRDMVIETVRAELVRDATPSRVILDDVVQPGTGGIAARARALTSEP